MLFIIYYRNANQKLKRKIEVKIGIDYNGKILNLTIYFIIPDLNIDLENLKMMFLDTDHNLDIKKLYLLYLNLIFNIHILKKNRSIHICKRL